MANDSLTGARVRARVRVRARRKRFGSYRCVYIE
jgi:hypothetical protein